MKKLIFIFAFIIGMTFTMNAQTVDTVKYVDTIQITINDSIDTPNMVSVIFDSTWHMTNGAVTFNVSGLTDGMALSLYVNGNAYSTTFNGWEIVEHIDTIINGLIHIDSVADSQSNMMVYDTIYYNDTIYSFDSTAIFDVLFTNGMNTFVFTDYTSIDSITFGVVCENHDSIDHVVTISDICFIDNYVPVNINDVDNTNITVYPNPVHNTLYINGNYTQAVLYDNRGRQVEKTKDHMINMSAFGGGIYFLKINNKTIKILKY